MGRRLAKTLVSANVLEYLEIADDYSLAELSASRFIHGRTIRELDVRAKYGVNIVAIKRGKEMLVSPQAEEKIFEGDLLIVIGSVQDIERFENKLTNK
jgi:TrkA-C domain.